MDKNRRSQRITLSSIKAKIVDAMSPRGSPRGHLVKGDKTSLDFMEKEVYATTKTVSKTAPNGSRYTQYRCHNAVQSPLQFQSPSSSYASHSSHSSQTASLPSPKDRDLTPPPVYSKTTTQVLHSKKKEPAASSTLFCLRRKLHVKKIDVKRRRNSI